MVSIAFPIQLVTALPLARTYFEDADGPDEVEFWPTDIDVGAVLNEPEGELGGNEVFTGIRISPRSLNRLTQASKVARW